MIKYFFILFVFVFLGCKTANKTQVNSPFNFGKVSQINIGCSNLNETIKFYEKIGYTNFNAEGNWAQLSDEETFLFLQEDKNVYTSLVYFDTTILKKRAFLDSSKVKEFKHQNLDGHLLSITLQSPENLYITMVQANPSAIEKPISGVNKRMGKLKYVRLYSSNLKQSIRYWLQFNFNIVSQNKFEVILTDNINTLQLSLSPTAKNPELIYSFKEASKQGFALELNERVTCEKQEFFIKNPDGFNCVLEQ